MKTVFYNGHVYTGELPLQSAFAISDGVFVKTGSDAEVLGEAYDEKVDLQGRFVCAGFEDSHMHLVNFGQSLQTVQLAGCTDSLQNVKEALKEHLKSNPVNDGQWLRGRGWNQDYFTDEKRMPDRNDLDEISADIPIMITRACGHACAVNSRVLEICGITKDTKCAEGGRIGMKDGEPDGLFFDNAMDLITPHLPLPAKEDVKNMIRAACAKLNEYGITAVQTDDYGSFRALGFETFNEAYRELEESGELSVRIYEQCNFTEFSDLQAFAEAGNMTGRGNDMFRIGPLKLLGDGSLGSRTAHLSIPYADDPSTSGFSLFSREKLAEMISYAHERGMQIAVHAIGDACLDEVLDAIETALQKCPRKDHRHGIVHCQISRPDQLERIARLNLHVYAQSIFLDYDNHIVEARTGRQLAGSSYSWKTLMKKGVSVSNGSDCPVELPDVMKGIECAVTRTSMDGTGPYLPHEAFTVQEAIGSFTEQSAYACFAEDRRGRIAEGYTADFTVLENDPFETDPYRLHEIPVSAVYLGGRKVYEPNR